MEINLEVQNCTSSGDLVGTFGGNTEEISWVGYNTNCDKCFSCSVDKSCCIWDSSSCEIIHKFKDFSDEVLFGCIANVNGRELFAACSTDKTAIVYDLSTYSILFKVEGHSGEVSRILSACFNKIEIDY